MHLVQNWNLVFHLSILFPLQVGDELQKNRKERLFFNAIHGITKTVDKIKDQKRTGFMKKEIEMEKAGFFKKMKKGWQGNSVNCPYPDNK